jgi:hypothetical protein
MFFFFLLPLRNFTSSLCDTSTIEVATFYYFVIQNKKQRLTATLTASYEYWSQITLVLTFLSVIKELLLLWTQEGLLKINFSRNITILSYQWRSIPKERTARFRYLGLTQLIVRSLTKFNATVTSRLRQEPLSWFYRFHGAIFDSYRKKTL